MATQEPYGLAKSDPGTSTIGQDLIITGDVTSNSALAIDGHIRGDVRCASLILGESSEVEGNVVAEDVVIRGRVIGSIRGDRWSEATRSTVRVILQSSCHVEGDLVHASLAMEQGAYFEGKSRRSENPLAEDHQRPKAPAVEQHEATDAPAEASKRFIRVLNGTKGGEDRTDKTSA